MAKAKKEPITKPKKEPKPRASKYDEKIVINGTFDDLVKDLINPINPTKKAVIL